MIGWIDNFQSSDIHSFRWVDGEYPLEVRFHRRPDGHTGPYRYKDVPKSKFDGLRTAKSKGVYFNAEIKNQYDFLPPS